MLLTAMLLLSVLSAWAQTDPTIMTIDGKPVSRSEFEYSYNKNNSEMVVDKKSWEKAFLEIFEKAKPLIPKQT